ncbi:unnamed protein product [Meloidogyne enterolobii]|uniref:Uncharacterized protein n=1 Tax=Meloidogyne enterolobii TaxID=390850 RepID=A0ACB0Y8N1_MELEN
MTNNNGCIISGGIDKGEIFKEFSTKFVSTVATSESDRSEVFYSFMSAFLLSIRNAGGTRDGWLLIEAIRQFDKDWSRTFFYYMNALELEDPKDLIRKLDGKVHMFRDGEKKLRVAVIKTEGNSDVMNLIDSAISRRAILVIVLLFLTIPIDDLHRLINIIFDRRCLITVFIALFIIMIWTSRLDLKELMTFMLEELYRLMLDLGNNSKDIHRRNFTKMDFLKKILVRAEFLGDTVSTISSASEDHKAPPFLDESRLLNCSATKKLRFLPHYFEKIYAADKEWLSNKKNKKNSIKNSNSSLSSSGSSAECIISRLCSEFAGLKIFD